MILWTTALLPICLGCLTWLLGTRLSTPGHPRRVLLGGAAALIVFAELLCALAAALTGGSGVFSWGGGLELTLRVDPVVRIVTVMIPLVAAPVIIWAAAAEAEEGLARLIGLLVGFTGTMQLLVFAADLLTIAIAWELLGFFSWLLIAHHWQEKEKIAAANYSFNATRLGGLGLWFAAAATLAATGNFDFKSLAVVAGGPMANWMAAGIFIAAAAKSAQGPFAAWLFRAMEGPSSVSALLHSSTMVAAGAWLLIRLHEPLLAVSWFGPAAIALGLTTAIAGGLTAIFQPDAKRLLAASTSAQYGLMFVAVGAGYPAAGIAHLVTHAAFKALLFLAAGSAISAVGTHALAKMRLGGRLPVIAAASWVGAWGLAALPPLGAAWSKEQIVTAAGTVSPWLAVLTIGAGMLSAWYALRFQALAFGRKKPGRREQHAASNLGVRGGVWLLAGWTILLSLLWLDAGREPIVKMTGVLPSLSPERSWETGLSLGAAVAAAIISWLVYRRPKAASGEITKSYSLAAAAADWWGLPNLIEVLVTKPTAALAASCAAFDRRIVDAGVSGAAASVRFISRTFIHLLESGIDRSIETGAAGWLWLADVSRRLLEGAIDRAVELIGTITARLGNRSKEAQSGAIPTYLAMLAGGFFIFFLILVIDL